MLGQGKLQSMTSAADLHPSVRPLPWVGDGHTGRRPSLLATMNSLLRVVGAP